jgi:hypothetical protein
MADGTPLESLENGDVQNAADAARMQEIMRDIDTPSGGAAPMGTLPAMQQSSGPMRPMMQQPPMYNPNVQMQQQYVAVEEEETKPKKKNIWSSILDRMKDPLIVALLVFLLSLPVLHTQLAKYASWAFAVGGQLSWLGLGSVSLLAGLLFGIYRGVSDLVG